MAKQTKTANKTSKTNKKSASKKRRTATRRRKAKRALPTVRILPALPERLESVDSIQKLYDQLGRREGELNEALGRLEDTYRDVTGRLGDLEATTRETAEKRLLELLERVRDSRAGELFDQLEGRAQEEADELLERVGLIRLAVHEDKLAKAKKRAKAAGKRAANKELDKQKKHKQAA